MPLAGFDEEAEEEEEVDLAEVGAWLELGPPWRLCRQPCDGGPPLLSAEAGGAMSVNGGALGLGMPG